MVLCSFAIILPKKKKYEDEKWKEKTLLYTHVLNEIIKMYLKYNLLRDTEPIDEI